MAGPADDKHQQARERARQHLEARAARHRDLIQRIDGARLPDLAEIWFRLVEGLCDPTGNPMRDALSAFWRASQRLAVGAKTLGTPRKALLGMRGATIGLPGDVDQARLMLANNPTIVRIRTQAAEEIGQLLVEHELRASQQQGGSDPDSPPPTPPHGAPREVSSGQGDLVRDGSQITRNGGLEHPKEVDFTDAMTRYSQSYDEMRTMRLNPLKIIPVDQWPEETQLRGAAIVHERDWKKYARYVLSVAAENERFARQARLWWAWWERAQVEPSKAGPAPLVSPPIEEALRISAARRRLESPIVTRAADTLKSDDVLHDETVDTAVAQVSPGIKAHLTAPKAGVVTDTPTPSADGPADAPTTPRTGKRRQTGGQIPRRTTPRKGLSDMATLVLRALPSSSQPALRTLGQIAAKVDTRPQPSEATVSRAVRELRSGKPPLVDMVSYRCTKAGDAAHRPA